MLESLSVREQQGFTETEVFAQKSSLAMLDIRLGT